MAAHTYKPLMANKNGNGDAIANVGREKDKRPFEIPKHVFSDGIV